MKGKFPEYVRGAHQAEALEDAYGLKVARDWLNQRMADSSKERLSNEYIRGFKATCDRLERLIDDDRELGGG